MIEPPVLLRMFDREDVGHLLHDADRRMVPFPVGADRTHLLVGEVVALRTVADLVAEPVDALRHLGHRIPLHAQDVDGQAQRRAASHARKLRKFADDVL